jgi:hypothetical protein
LAEYVEIVEQAALDGVKRCADASSAWQFCEPEARIVIAFS